MMITRELLRNWSACYSADMIATYVPLGGLTPLEVCDVGIPALDKLWVLLRPSIIPEKPLRLLVCKWAEQACDTAGLVEVDSREAIEVSRRYAAGEATLNELMAAHKAAQYVVASHRLGPILLWSAARTVLAVTLPSGLEYGAYHVAKNAASTELYATGANHNSIEAYDTHDAACVGYLNEVRALLETLT